MSYSKGSRSGVSRLNLARRCPRSALLTQRRTLEALVDADLDTLATALYVRTDDLLKITPERAPWRPAVGIAPKISDAEVVTLAVMQALLGFTSEARWLRFATDHLRHLFPYLPHQPGYNKRLRRLAETISWLIGALARDATVWTDDVWVIDSTPVECARSREAVRRSDLAGWAEYGYCASHSRHFWGLQAAPAVLPARASDRLRTHRREGRRAARPTRHPHRSHPRRPAAAAAHRRQELLRPRLRDHARCRRRATATPRPQGRARPARRPVLQTAASSHRVDQRHLQRPTRPRTPRRPNPPRGPRPGPATHPRLDHRHLVQRPHRAARQTVTTGLRPLTPLGTNHLGCAGMSAGQLSDPHL